jgi:two-component system response regulator NreC
VSTRDEGPRAERDSASTGKLAALMARVARGPYARRGVPMSAKVLRVALASDHVMCRQGLRALLVREEDLTIVGEGGSGDVALSLATRLAPDVLVLDLDVGSARGLAALRDVVRTLPDLRVLVLAGRSRPDDVLQALETGAHGHLTKEAAANELLDAIRVVASGEIYVRPAMARVLATPAAFDPVDDSPRGRFDTLSSREQSILKGVAEGFSGAEVADQLGISAKTVAAYKRRIQEKLGIAHRTEYVRFAVEAGILGPRGDAPPASRRWRDGLRSRAAGSR